MLVLRRISGARRRHGVVARGGVGGSLQPEGHGGAPSRSAKLPDKTIGYCALLPRPAPSCQHPSHLWYPPRTVPDLKTWNLDSCKKGSKSLMCSGPASRNLNVIFSGEATLSGALTVAFQKQATALRKSLSETRLLRPFSADAGLHTGLQFISLGGSNAAGAFSNETLHGAGFTPKGLASVKAAGFSGICFDVEVTEGGADTLAAALEAAFVACKKAGMLVMVTTSHTAPYAAATDHTKRLLVDSWVNSSSIDIFSPQLYTSGYEPAPQFELTPCLPTDTLFESRCSWERLKKIKAMWVPSLSSAEHYPAAEEFFAKLDIQTRGFVQWRDPDDPKLPRIPDELTGYYLKAWNLGECKPHDTPMVCSGP